MQDSDHYDSCVEDQEEEMEQYDTDRTDEEDHQKKNVCLDRRRCKTSTEIIRQDAGLGSL